ncbi:MAG: AAA family ATPase, partial [Gemmatimonadaceae bacterium]|nr:AAA family ATPase [Gemmatimonadaceae bacterium]
SGKSTLLEGIAMACGLPAVGAVDRIAEDPSLEEQQWLARALKLSWRARSYRGFFLRAEAFFGFQQRLMETRLEFQADLARLEHEYMHRSAEAKVLATGPARTSLMEFEARYGANPDAKSHGEAFLNFFQKRLTPNGLFLMDEPEAALSPQRQLALLAMMFEAVADGGQFIIATHSPLILAYPGARIYSFDDEHIEQVAWDRTEHVRLTRDFLSDPERYLRRLRDDA